jgi:hypothetical protein
MTNKGTNNDKSKNNRRSLRDDKTKKTKQKGQDEKDRTERAKQRRSLGQTAGPSTAPLAIRRQEASLRMTVFYRDRSFTHVEYGDIP